jgi:hypothetical protein
LRVRPHQLRQRLTGFAQGDLEVSAEVSAKNLARVSLVVRWPKSSALANRRHGSGLYQQPSIRRLSWAKLGFRRGQSGAAHGDIRPRDRNARTKLWHRDSALRCLMRAGAFLRDGDPVRPVLADDTSAGK